jgi:hypothetical protein
MAFVITCETPFRFSNNGNVRCSDPVIIDSNDLGSNDVLVQTLIDSLDSLLVFDQDVFIAGIAGLASIFIASFVTGIIVRNLMRI